MNGFDKLWFDATHLDEALRSHEDKFNRLLVAIDDVEHPEPADLWGWDDPEDEV